MLIRFLLSLFLMHSAYAQQTLSVKTVSQLHHPTLLHIQAASITAEVVSDDASRKKGLMFRSSLAKNAGMLFVFPDSQIRCFWMKNTIIPLSIAFIDENGIISDIFNMQPLDESPICSTTKARFALETNLGWFKRHHINIGHKVTFTP